MLKQIFLRRKKFRENFNFKLKTKENNFLKDNNN